MIFPFCHQTKVLVQILICILDRYGLYMRLQLCILVFGQGLWFGDRMDRSLINPNQCRSYGILLCNDPKDPQRTLGFQTNTLNIPLFAEVKIATMSTHCPSLEELDSCQYIYLSDQEIWDPLNMNFKIMLMEEDSRHSIAS